MLQIVSTLKNWLYACYTVPIEYIQTYKCLKCTSWTKTMWKRKSIRTFYIFLDLCHFPLRIIPYENLHCRCSRILFFFFRIQMCVFLMNFVWVGKTIYVLKNIKSTHLKYYHHMHNKIKFWRERYLKKGPFFLELNMHWQFGVRLNDFVEKSEMFYD